MLFRRHKDKETGKGKQRTGISKYKLSDSLDANVQLFQQIFNDDDTFKVRYFENQQHPQVRCCVLFIECMADNEIINENIIQPIVQNTMLENSGDILSSLQNQVIVSNHVVKTTDIDKLSAAIIRGDTVLFLDGWPVGLMICSKGWASRPIKEPQGERVASGPREGFTESIMVNLTMIRRKLETPHLKMKIMTIGVQTNTKICVCYVEGIVHRKILDEVYKRLKGINIDGILDAAYINELIKDSPFSPLNTIGKTERPDIAAAKLLEGHIAVVVDGTPVVLTIPLLFVENFQSNEDYYVNFYFATTNRLLRVMGFIITISVPAVYTALVTFHQEAIPTPLLLSISAARQGVPFPTIVEVILLLLIFEILRETGLRMPYFVGQTLSIIGAIVLGTASVEAKLVSAPIVIVVSITAITGLMIPGIKVAAIFLRFIFLFLSAFIGLYGYIFGVMGFLVYLCQLRSFGVPYMLTLTTLDPGELKDTAVRAPWWYMKLRPKLITANRVRQANGGKLQ